MSKVGQELLLKNLKPEMQVALEGVTPPDPLYLMGEVSEIVSHCVVVRILLGPSVYLMLRLHADRGGRFVNDADQPVRVLELVP
jgi:hypothetical protein